MARISYISMR